MFETSRFLDLGKETQCTPKLLGEICWGLGYSQMPNNYPKEYLLITKRD